MVCCPCSNCWSKTKTQSQDATEPPSPRVQLSVPSQRYIIDEEIPTEDDFDDLIVRPIPGSKKRLQMRDGNNSLNKNRLHLVNNSRRRTDGQRKQTVLSDWGDAYDGYDSFRLSNNLNTRSQFTEEWTCVSDGTRTSNVPTLTAKMSLLPGNVLVMQLTKGDPIFRIIKLESTLNELVESLSANSGGVKLPVSFTESEYQRPKLMKENRMAMSIQDNLGRNLDVSTQGLTFSVGPLNTKLCYKMTVVDLGQLEKIFSLTQENKRENIMEEDL